MKRLIGNLRMSVKLMLAPLIGTLFLVLLASVSYTGLSDQKQAIDELAKVRFKTYQNASQTMHQMAIVHKDVFKILGFADSGMDESKIQQLAGESLKALVQLKDFTAGVGQGAGLTTREQEFFLSSFKEIEEYEGAVNKVLQMATADVSMALTMMAPLEKRFLGLNQKLEDLLAYESDLSNQSLQRSLASYELTLKSFGGVLAGAILLSLLANFFMARLITAPVRQAMGVIKVIAEGDLTQDIGATFKDEIGQLARSVDSMRVKVAEAVGQSVEMSGTLSEASSRQAASIEETSSTLEEMAAMARQNSGNTVEATKLMAQAETVIRGADASMGELTGAMKEIAEASEQTRKIIKGIDEIAFQTNLLALNAAVEAARAGEAGAGFAVVADEVRNLAMRAAQSAKNTSELTEDIVVKVKKGEALVAKTYESFRAVTEKSSKVVKLIEEVASATHEQTTGMDQINKAVAELNAATQQNAASAEQLSAIMSMFKTEAAGGGGWDQAQPAETDPAPRGKAYLRGFFRLHGTRSTAAS
jgi:methyl-accepting chemotaxis protein